MAPRSYGSLPVVANEWDPLVNSSYDSPDSSFDLENNESRKKRNYGVWVTVLGAVAAVGVTVVAILGGRSHWMHSSSFLNKDASAEFNEAWLKSPKSLGLHSVERGNLMPSKAWGAALESGRPLPTNAWYLNLLSDQAGTSQNTEASRVYTVPYIIDTVGKIPGIRVHWPTIQASTRNIQMVMDVSNGVTLGATQASPHYQLASNDAISPLGLALKWKAAAATSSIAATKNKESIPSSEQSSSVESHGEEEEEGDSSFMVAPIVRGMPFATMEYYKSPSSSALIPTVLASKVLASDPIADNSTTWKCGPLEVTSSAAADVGDHDGGNRHHLDAGTSQRIEKEISLHFKGSDFTWMIFVSRPVMATCASAPDPESQASSSTPENNPIAGPGDILFQLQLFQDDGSGDNDEEDAGPLVVRLALVNECTTGKATIAAHCDETRRMVDPKGYIDMLRRTAHLRPGLPSVELDFGKDSDIYGANNKSNTARIVMDWNSSDSSSMKASSSGAQILRNHKDEEEEEELIMFALHYQQEMLETTKDSSNAVLYDFCTPTFHGRTCLVKGRRWSLVENLGPKPSLSAARPPKADSMELLAQTLKKDIQYVVSDNLLRGAADTYFSGKVLARLGRVIAIADELKTLSSDPRACETLYDPELVDLESCKEAAKAAKEVELPSDHEVRAALEGLRDAVEVWFNGLAEAAFVYDNTWGGLINCGCNYTVAEGETGDKGKCSNTAPYDCPAFESVNVDFGNGWYNDHHYHYGYHVYAAAIVAQFDPDWALKWMDHIMLYIRDIANPSKDDPYFPQYRHKDWYVGSSWASGLASFNEFHGRNQESSSEAIAAYEGVALFGSAMQNAITQAGKLHSSEQKGDYDLKVMAATAREVYQSGRLLMAMELHATQRYWHVWNSTEHVNSYPPQYNKPVVGMMYETMASFQTWFDGGDMASIGIQLLPFTPVAEARDDPVWAAETFVAYKQSCMSDHDFCVKNGWSVMLSGLEATIGHYKDALDDAMLIPDKVFESEGGCGHSRTNLIWYIATRPKVDNITNPTNATEIYHL